MLDATTDEMATVIPNGFKNNILWNLGHIYVSQDQLLYSFLGEQHTVPTHYVNLFRMNTSPADWTGGIPSLAELRVSLETQPERLIETFTGRLYERLEKPFKLGPENEFTTLAEMICFANFHEGIHQGVINSIKRTLGVEDLWTALTK